MQRRKHQRSAKSDKEEQEKIQSNVRGKSKKLKMAREQSESESLNEELPKKEIPEEKSLGGSM